jgi:hypothetical protein
MTGRLRLAVLAMVLAVAAALWLFLRTEKAPAPADSAALIPAHAPPDAGIWSDPSAVQRSLAEVPGAEEEGEAPRLRLRLLDGEGRPAAGALIAQLDFSVTPALLIGVHQTDEQGEAEVGAWDEEPAASMQWVVSHANHAPLLVPAATEPGLQVLQLEALVALAGRVRVEGVAPGEVLRVDVRGFRDPAAAWPAAAREILAQWGLGSGATVCWVAADGSFAVRGLPAGEVLELTFPQGFLLRDDLTRRHPAVLSVTTPALDLQVELTRLPAIRGILMRHLETSAVTASAGGDLLQIPVFPSLLLVLEWTLVRGGEREEGTAWLSSGQSFTIPLTAPLPDRAELRVRDADSTLLGWRELPGPFDGGADLGTWIVPDPERSIDLTVEDERGQPIPNAIVVAHRAVHGRTGADGRVRLGLRAPPGILTIGAFGYRLQRVPVTEPAPAAITVRLEAASRLRLEVSEPDGSPARPLVAVLSYGDDLVPDAPEAVPDFEEVRGPPCSGAMWSQGWREHHYPLSNGAAEWSDLPDGAPLTLQVRDLHDFVLHEEILLLSGSETRLVRVLLPRAGRAITGRLLTPEGDPIAGGKAALGGWFQETATDAEGRFRIENYYGDAPSLMLWADGRVSRFTLPSEYADGRDWILEPARTVWIIALDPRGARCAAGLGPLLEIDGGWSGAGQERGPGLYEINGVPLRPGTVSVPETAIAPVRIGPEQTEVTIAVPD